MDDDVLPIAPMYPYEVARHSGRNGGEWRTVLATADFEKAEAKYRQLFTAMRQGGVQLLNNGFAVKNAWAPRLRTKW